MTIVFRKDTEQRFTADEVLWAKDALVQAVVRQALLGQTEATIDMTIDCQEQMDASELTRDGLQKLLGNVKDAAADFLDDVLGDLQLSIGQALDNAQYGAVVTGIKYGLAGDIKDIEVDITVN